MRLYFGRIAPIPPQKEQVDGGGWAWRYKVRIFDKHTPDKDILEDKDLPWAQVLMPVTAGSGAANYAVTPSINQGDTVSIAYYDDDEEMPIITGILPRTTAVSKGEPSDDKGFIPHTGFTDNKTKSKWMENDESNESNEGSQPSTRSDKFSSTLGDTITAADVCDPNAYKVNAVSSEINNLFNQVQQFSDDASYIETLITGTVDRVHAITNPYVGEMFNNVFESLVPVLNAGLKALYEQVFALVLAATGSTTAARLAAEAALIALKPAILALQEAILLLANEVVRKLYEKVDSLVRDTIKENNNFTDCGTEQFTGALVNAIIFDIDLGLQPLLNAVDVILSGGFQAATAIRSSIDIVSDFGGGLLSIGQGGNKCGGLVREYAFGIGPKSDVGDILDKVLEGANIAKSLVDLAENVSGSAEDVIDGISAISDFQKQFGDFPFLSETTGYTSDLDNCSTEPPTTCHPPEVFIFGGRGEGAKAKARVGNYIESQDSRTVKDVQGGVVTIEVEDGGEGYEYPPFVEVRDNCKLGIGCIARSVIKDGKVDRIYVVNPGKFYPSDGTELFVVERVEIIAGGSGYTPGTITDNSGGTYEIVTDDNGRVTDIIPETITQVPENPVLNIPEVNPPIPPGGNVVDGNVVDSTGKIIGPATIGVGLIYNPILISLPSAQQVLDGTIPESLVDRFGQKEILRIIDCPD